jgi:hypothetical protein
MAGNSSPSAASGTFLALGGAAVGGALGWFLFFWLAKRGLLGLILPGGLLGLGAGVVRNRSILIAVVCGLSATALGVYAEFCRAPFEVDESLRYFLHHLADLNPVKLIMIAVGGVIGFWIPFQHRVVDQQKPGIRDDRDSR